MQFRTGVYERYKTGSDLRYSPDTELCFLRHIGRYAPPEGGREAQIGGFDSFPNSFGYDLVTNVAVVMGREDVAKYFRKFFGESAEQAFRARLDMEFNS